MSVLGAAVVGFVAGIVVALLLDEYIGFQGGLWDMLAILIGVGGALVGIRLAHLRSHSRRPGPHHHRHA